jgi:hypothetical protein
MTVGPPFHEADPRITAAARPMSPTQWGVVVMTVALSALDGFDVLAVPRRT